MPRFILVLSILIFNLSATRVSAVEHVKIYTYHLKAPFVIDERNAKGLEYDATRYFNEHTDEFQFSLIYLPRKRLDLMMQNDTLDGIVIGVAPVWFGDKNEKRYLWTSVFLNDANEVISSRENPFEYTGLDSLKNQRLGLVLGHYYEGISELAQRRLLTREDASSEDHQFRKLLAKRMDLAIISRSNYDYMMKHEPDLSGKFHVSKLPFEQINRKILLPLRFQKVQATLDAILHEMSRDPAWQSKIAEYR